MNTLTDDRSRANAVTQRPLVRRIASRVRAASYRLLTPIDRFFRGPEGAPLPPAHLRIFYYGTLRRSAFVRQCERARTEVLVHGLKQEHRVLDIGSGIGNLALGLTDYLRGTYHGIEIHSEAVVWCQKAITRIHPNFQFHHADVVSRAYNPRGRLRACEYTFPFPAHSFDFIFLASVFTHMLPDDVEHYVREISRLLAPGGVCVASYFLLNDQTRTGVDRHASFMSFDVRHPSGVCRLHDATVPEAAVAFEQEFVERIHDRAGLRLASIRRGRWWDGGAHDQDVAAAVRLDTHLSPDMPHIETA